jgi:hypothetical protein
MMLSSTTETDMTDMTVANEILAQLGGAHAVTLMTGRPRGTHKFIGTENSLTVKIGGGALKQITIVKITLNRATDSYDIEFGKVRKYEYIVVDSLIDVPVENLRSAFTRTTGFELLVPRIVGINA